MAGTKTSPMPLPDNTVQNKGPRFGTRHVQILLLSLCLFVTFATRTSFSVQLVAMTTANSSSNPDITAYDWSKTNIILSAFFWTYVAVNLIVGPLEKKFGVKWLFLGAILLNTTAFTLIPVIASKCGSIGVLVCRLAQGMGQGFLFPTQQLILGTWVPSDERARAGMVASVGVSLAAMISSGLTGYLCSTWWGWPSSFYVFGLMGYTWCLLYLIFGQSSPESHPRITREEKSYILTSLHQQENVKVSIPWMRIVTSRGVLINLVAHIGVAWTVNIFITEFAAFLDKIMHFDIKSNGLISALAGFFGLTAGVIFGPLSDYLINHGLLTTVTTRKLFHLVGGVGLSTCFILLSFLNETQKIISIIILAVINISQASISNGNLVNMVDMSPRFAGVIFGLVNSFAQSIGLFAPIVVQYVVLDSTDIYQWRIVFFLTATISLGTSVIFAIFASGDRQPWDGEEAKPATTKRGSIASITSYIGTTGTNL